MAKFQTHIHGEKNKKVIFLLTGWLNRWWMFWLISKIISLHGYCCITYTYDNEILSPNPTKTVEIINEIKQDVLNKIQNYKKAGYSQFDIFGTSLGTIITILVANTSDDISHVILNMTTADIAKVIWSWEKVIPNFKQHLLDRDITLDALTHAWKTISPVENSNNLQNKRMLIYLSTKDEILPYPLSVELIHVFKKRNYTFHVVTNRHLGHVLTGTYNLLNSRVYFKFLNDR